MILTKVKNNLQDPAYYFSQILGILSVSFLVIIWLYLARIGLVKLTNQQIIFYFFSILSFNYLFTYSLIDSVANRFKYQAQSFLLNPCSIYKTLFIKDFLPIILNNLPLIILSLLVSLIFDLSLNQFLFFIFLQIIVHLVYFFISIIGAIFQVLLNWDYISFAFRFLGQTWNGSYIPLIFLTGSFLSFALFLPIFYSGVPFQLLLTPHLDFRFLLNIFIFGIISFIVSFFMLRHFQKYVQQ